MIVVAVLLLPFLGLLLFGMDRLETRMFDPPSRPSTARHGRRRGHLRLIGGTATEHRHRRAEEPTVEPIVEPATEPAGEPAARVDERAGEQAGAQAEAA